MFANDKNCLESLKASFLVESGAFIGVIKKNLNNTLHDKEINVVHIPILELDPTIYDKIVKFKKENPNTSVSMVADFN